MATVTRALLFINLHKDNARPVADAIREELRRKGIESRDCAFTGKPDTDVGGPYDLAFSLGGDGTVLYAARSMAPYGAPVFPINLGTLGFIAAVHPDEWIQVFNGWLAGAVGVSRRFMLEVTVERAGGIIARGSCLNDTVISASGIAKIIRLKVEAETQFPREYMRLGNYRSDGLIVATPTGSTAYSVSAGGPILDPEMEAIIINPVCPFTLSNRPIVVPAREAVIVEIEGEQRSGVLLTLDGQVTEPLAPGDRVYIKQAPYEAKLIASDRKAFYKALRTKLSWSGGSDA
ncbi:MAG: NAD(+)/NADH kinase [Spirochaetaceae bacterium]|jgi:NAD+ kinase|nr:NAD(+)/NADH kinase [Spirochaetaceae bacterium]